mgnify:CR=1 FL=1
MGNNLENEYRKPSAAIDPKALNEGLDMWESSGGDKKIVIEPKGKTVEILVETTQGNLEATVKNK